MKVLLMIKDKKGQEQVRFNIISGDKIQNLMEKGMYKMPKVNTDVLYLFGICKGL